MQDLIGLLLSILLVFICFVIAYPVSKKNPETARKIVHIGAAHWYFIYAGFFTSPVPALIGLPVVAALVAAANATGMFDKTLGQGNKKRNWGLVWYPVSIFIMILMGKFGIGGMTELGVGLLGMGWGDGLAAIVGMKFGKHRLNTGKSLEGMAAFFAAVTVIAFLFTHNILLSVVCGLTGAVFEFTTPFGLDNITVPLVLYATVAFWPKSAMLLGFALMACLAYKWKLLTANGVVGAFVLAVLCTWIFGLAGLVLLLAYNHILAGMPGADEGVTAALDDLASGILLGLLLALELGLGFALSVHQLFHLVLRHIELVGNLLDGGTAF